MDPFVSLQRFLFHFSLLSRLPDQRPVRRVLPAVGPGPEDEAHGLLELPLGDENLRKKTLQTGVSALTLAKLLFPASQLETTVFKGQNTQGWGAGRVTPKKNHHPRHVPRCFRSFTAGISVRYVASWLSYGVGTGKTRLNLRYTR